MWAAGLTGVIAVAGCAWIAAATRRAGYRLAAGALGLVSIVAATLLLLRVGAVAGESAVPLNLYQVDYVQSQACARCHQDHYRSWHDTYHRTMTQEATPDAVIGDFSVGATRVGGHDVALLQEGDAFFMELVDREWERRPEPTADRSPPRKRYRVDRLVGSHELQVYLTRLESGAYLTLPLEWNHRDRRWVTSATNYLQPPVGATRLFSNTAIWNNRCVYCHNTRPNPGRDASAATFDTKLEEMGIACEACHGPGGAHIAANRDPIRRAVYQQREQADPTIVNPSALSQHLALEVCGRCHGKWIVRGSHRALSETRGDPHVPGQRPLTVAFFDPVLTASESGMAATQGYFWPDLTPRATAMEYQGVTMSPCAQRGPMRCESCHSMHDAPDDDQLRFRDDPQTAPLEHNAACTQCHGDFADDAALAAHSHHAPTSSGSACVDCHMPFQTFGLMKQTRSHRIASPDAHITQRAHLPNGCNQCHVERSLAWTARALTEWYDAPALLMEPDDPRATWSETLVQLARGHALSRALAARQLDERAGRWAIPFLLRAMNDDYAAVRSLAEKALRSRPAFTSVVYDYTEPGQAADALLDAWEPGELDIPASVPLRADGTVDEELWGAWVAQRDHTPLAIFE